MSPPSLSLPEGVSGASASNSHSKPFNRFGQNRSNTPSYAAASRTDSLYSKRRVEYKNSIKKEDATKPDKEGKISPLQSF